MWTTNTHCEIYDLALFPSLKTNVVKLNTYAQVMPMMKYIYDILNQLILQQLSNLQQRKFDTRDLKIDKFSFSTENRTLLEYKHAFQMYQHALNFMSEQRGFYSQHHSSHSHESEKYHLPLPRFVLLKKNEGESAFQHVTINKNVPKVLSSIPVNTNSSHPHDHPWDVVTNPQLSHSLRHHHHYMNGNDLLV